MDTKNRLFELGEELKTWFTDDMLETMAKTTGFIKRRSSRLTAKEFFNLVTVDILQEPNISYEGLCDKLESRNPAISMTPQALCERMNSKAAVTFMREVFENTLKKTLHAKKTALESQLLEPFARVLLEDSTSIQLNEKLADEFKGCGGKASRAGVKIDYSFDIKNLSAVQIAIRQGRENDQSFANSLASSIKKDDLIIRDLGYFNLDFFSDLDQRGAFFLSRLGAHVLVYLSKEAENPFNLIRHINRHSKDNVLDLNVFIGKEQRQEVRLLVYRLPKEVYRERQREAIKAAKSRGKRCQLNSLKFLKYSFFVTNVPANRWSAAVIGTIYRLRWQIELVFKNWKSLFNFDILKGSRPERIFCLIYGRLIAILVVNQLLANLAVYAAANASELSFPKVIQWLMRNNRFLKAYISRQFEDLLTAMRANCKRLLKQKRKRLSTWQSVAAQVSYLDSFAW